MRFSVCLSVCLYLGHAVEDVLLGRVLVEYPIERELEVAHLVSARADARCFDQALYSSRGGRHKCFTYSPGANSSTRLRTWTCRCSPALRLTSTDPSVSASAPGRSRAYTPMEVSFMLAGVARASTSRNIAPHQHGARLVGRTDSHLWSARPL